ncbi:MAG: TetR/AcrR family bet gene transcriptional repressor [Flavobacteriales bacterium]|jgi:TetR/AcrR family transcriptional repressor of bet genes
MLSQVTEKNLPSRNRALQSEFRKRQLINSTIDCIEKLGLPQTTIASIAKHAGVSQGIVVFHFQSKEALLEQTLRRLSNDYANCWKNAYDNAAITPLARLCALIEAVFSPTVCTRKLIGVWYAFWGDSRSRLLYKSLCGKQDIAYSNCLLEQCQTLETTESSTMNARAAALSIESMIGGLWQEFLIGSSGFKQKEAVSTVFKLLRLIYPDRCHEIERLQKND